MLLKIKLLLNFVDMKTRFLSTHVVQARAKVH